MSVRAPLTPLTPSAAELVPRTPYPACECSPRTPLPLFQMEVPCIPFFPDPVTPSSLPIGASWITAVVSFVGDPRLVPETPGLPAASPVTPACTLLVPVRGDSGSPLLP